MAGEGGRRQADAGELARRDRVRPANLLVSPTPEPGEGARALPGDQRANARRPARPTLRGSDRKRSAGDLAGIRARGREAGRNARQRKVATSLRLAARFLVEALQEFPRRRSLLGAGILSCDASVLGTRQ